MHRYDQHSTHLLPSPGHSRIERSGCYSAISALPYGGQEMHCSIQQPSSQRGYGKPEFSRSRSPELYRLSPSRGSTSVGLYDSNGAGRKYCDKKLLEYNAPPHHTCSLTGCFSCCSCTKMKFCTNLGKSESRIEWTAFHSHHLGTAFRFAARVFAAC